LHVEFACRDTALRILHKVINIALKKQDSMIKIYTQITLFLN